jgi:NADH dehydrogenase
MATIGRAAAVADLRGLHLSGFTAWLMWLFVHLMYLVGFRNRLLVFVQWMWNYFTYRRGVRLIVDRSKQGQPSKAAQAAE